MGGEAEEGGGLGFGDGIVRRCSELFGMFGQLQDVWL